MSLVVIAEGDELVEVEVARDWCRATSDDDAQIEAILPAARETVENFTGRSLIARTYIARFDHFPRSRVINLERPPLRSVTYVKYVDQNGELQTLSSSLYTVDTHSEPGRIVLDSDNIWPSTDYVPGAVRIEYEAGYIEQPDVDPDPQTTIPKGLLQAVKFLVAHWFSNREPSSGMQSNKVPLTFDTICGSWKVNF